MSSLFWFWAFILLVVIFLISWLFVTILNWTWFPEAIVAWGTLLLAVATFKLAQTSISEGRAQRERESIKRRIDEVQQWIEGALGIRSKFAIPKQGLFEEDFRAEALEPTSVYAMLEARLLDELILTLRPKYTKEIVFIENTLESLVQNIVTLLKGQAIDSLNRLKNEKEIRKDCEVALAKLSDLKAKLNL